MKLNTDKCCLRLNSQETNTLKIGDLRISNSLSEKLLGITFGCKLKFNKNNKDICHSQDLHHTWKQPKIVFLRMRFLIHNLSNTH